MSLAAIAEPSTLAILVGPPLLLVATRLAKVRGHAVIALLQDSTPVTLILAWFGLAVALAVRAWPVAAIAAGLSAYHVLVLGRLATRKSPPRWVRHAPTTTVALANIYVDNDELATSASQLIGSGADVLVVVETTPAFRAAFDAAGGRDRYPHRTFDPDDDSAYAVSLYSAVEPSVIEMIDIGELRAATATITVGGQALQVVGAIPMAAVERGGYSTWRRQVRALSSFAERVQSPLVVAGDLNSTVHREGFTDLDRAGLHDAHGALGLGWRGSFMLAARGLFARLPLVRLDHALTNRLVWATDVRDLDHAGSDHRPFVVTLAVRPD